jgi:diguanylate cyclase (GGDEF)-like protein/PAS domain S-box-containing protein
MATRRARSAGSDGPPPTERTAPAPAGKVARLRILIKAVEQSPVSILVTDFEGRIEYVNPKFCQVSGYALEEVIGLTPRILKGGFIAPELYQELWATIRAGGEWHGVFHNRTKSGQLIWELASISPIRDERGVITHFVGVKEDITELKRLQDQLDQQAHHDPLTGLANRSLFYDRLAHTLALAKRRKSGFAVLYLDLDGFKAVNDAYGHDRGDSLLTLVGLRLLESVRESDTVARMGGDEFTIILADLEARDHAEGIAQVILEALTQPFALGEEVCNISASIGISIYPEDGEDVETLIASADAAMYLVKHTGKNNYRIGGGE